MTAIKGNGGEQKIEQLTADAIRQSILKTADDMRAAAKQAKQTAVELEKEAEELAQQLVNDGSGFADRVGGLLEKCRAASESFQKHRTALSKLPDIGAPNATDKALTAIEELVSLPKMERDMQRDKISDWGVSGND